MSEYEEFDGHQASEQVEETPEVQETEQFEQPSEPEAIPQAFKVKYNKEEIDVPYEQATDYIQKGMNYDKVTQRVSDYERSLERIAKITGYTNSEEMIQYLDEVEKQAEEQRFQEMGIDKETFNSYLSEHPDIQFARQVREEKAQEARLASEGQELFAEFPNLKVDEIPQEVWALRETKGLSLLDSYLRVNYKSLAQQKEQEVISKIQNNNLSSVGALDREGVQPKSGYGGLSSAEKKALRERVLRGENVQF